ncbi:hypothetical protein N7520_009686 [Penicillium odoratum]|uniref:uncharacterized protein n=1 Tax=Penicillium odoratum TaxID=1167516 RepID=UPI002546AC29|nr:uncharacterized protein N7520_009686 [Penicillium odoratum]KAJ5752769.1 hypothetical protein N7520_009686 [Penicillium odoratum]
MASAWIANFVKDNLHIKGIDSAQGLTSRVDKPVQFNSPIIQLLRDAGAMVYVKTSVPPRMKRAETYSIMLGETLDPKNHYGLPNGN